MRVDRCVCFDVTFGELEAYARETGCDLDGLSARFGCGRGCGLCIPYIRRMLETGETSFELIPPGPKKAPTSASLSPQSGERGDKMAGDDQA